MGSNIVTSEAQDVRAYGVNGEAEVNEDFSGADLGEVFPVEEGEDFPLVRVSGVGSEAANGMGPQGHWIEAFSPIVIL